jgi:hypothetical protein
VSAHETCCSGGNVDDITTGVINHTTLVQESTTPETVCSDRVRERDPERDENHPGVEIHASEESTCHDDDGDGCENKLEIHHGGQREILANTGGWQTRLL